MFLKSAKRCVHYFLSFFGLLSLFSLANNGSALLEDGWFRSFKEGKSVDRNGDPIPWLTYSAIDFIKPRLKSTFDLFEYGCGNSTLFYAGLVHTVTSVEHEKRWATFVQKNIPENVTLLFQGLEYGGDYCKSCISQDVQYDVVIIDGRDRVNCVKSTVSSGCLKRGGVIVFDNADRDCYEEAYSLLFDSGYKRIDFWGIGPIVHIKTCTSVFYRSHNVLGI